MKVIVCFDSVRVIVPCGEGDLLVRELVHKAVQRYKKATGKASSHWVNVLNLKTISGGGILDPDDQLQDVVDDREQLIADFEEEGRPALPHNGGDGASASSTGTTSPDIFQLGDSSEGGGESNQGGGGSENGDSGSKEEDSKPTTKPASTGVSTSPTFPVLSRLQNGRTDILVTTKDLSVGSSLRVRRGSEPALNTLGADAIQRPLIPINNGIISLHRRESVRESDEPRSESSDEEKRLSGGILDKKRKNHFAKFSRDAFRTSLSNRPEMFVWMEAQERQEDKFKQTQQDRKGPVGATVSENDAKKDAGADFLMVSFTNDGGPLGIHVVPANDDNGRDMGLMIQSVETGGRVHQDGRLSAHDRIVEINGDDLASVTFQRAQEIFRSAMKTDEIHLKIIKRKPPKPAARHPPPLMPKPRHAPAKPSPLTMPQKKTDDTTSPPSPEKESSLSDATPPSSTSTSTGETTFVSSTPKASSGSSNGSTNSRSSIADASPISKKTEQPTKPGPQTFVSSPTKKTPPAVPVRHPTTSLSTQLKDRPIVALTNTRKIGKKIKIDLKKGPQGLGFSVTSRDNVTDGDVPIYIKNILPKGAAIQDGQLKPGDRLLEVNGMSVAGKSQADIVTYLRNTPQNSTVSLLVSRQEEVDERFKMPRELDPDLDEVHAESIEKESKDEGKKKAIDKHDAIDVLPQPADRAGDDSFVSEKVPLDVIHLEIPLNDSGSAGLGVSVKGKTVSAESGVRDLGIFVKSIMQGGAASKDGRLLLNDQLLEVNGINLKSMSNIAAMESLRQAMSTEGSSKGCIHLTVGRRVGGPSRNPFSDKDGGQAEMVMLHYRTQSDLSQQSDDVDSPLHLQHSFSKLSDSECETPVQDRLKNGIVKLGSDSLISGITRRNESYMRATQDSLNDSESFLTSPLPARVPEKIPRKLTAPTVNPTVKREEEVIIEEDTYAKPVKSSGKQRPHSTIGTFVLPPLQTHDIDQAENSIAEESDLSPTDPMLTFQREGFGRQSMSEKRKGHVDPRSSEFYQKAKATKDQKEKGMESNSKDIQVTADSLVRSGSLESLPTTIPNPSLQHDPNFSMYQPSVSVGHIQKMTLTTNLKRSSSLEDLSAEHEHTSDQIRQESDLPAWHFGRVGRVRTCNESFRVAVDRSYDPGVDTLMMDTLEEESMESGSISLGQRSTSGRSSLSSENAGDDTTTRSKKKTKDKKSGGGLLKGFLRFGKGRKSTEDVGPGIQSRLRSRSEERPSHLMVNKDVEMFSHDRKVSHQDNEERSVQDRHYRRIQEEQQRRFQLQQQQQQQLQQQRMESSSSSLQSDAGSHTFLHSSESSDSSLRQFQQNLRTHFPAINHPGTERGREEEARLVGQALTRAERIQQLRMTHQQQHRARQGAYPLDHQEELFEHQLLEDERQRMILAEREAMHIWPLQGVPSGSYSHHYNRSSSRQSDTYRNNPYPSVSSMGSDISNHSHHSGHNYPPRTSVVVQHHRDHHDVYDPRLESHYSQNGGGGGSSNGGVDLYGERQRLFYDDGVQGYRDPRHRTGYSVSQRPVHIFTDPGSAKV